MVAPIFDPLTLAGFNMIPDCSVLKHSRNLQKHSYSLVFLAKNGYVLMFLAGLKCKTCPASKLAYRF